MIVSVAQAWAGLVMGTALSVQWHTGLFDHMLRLPLAFFEKRHIGDVVSRFGSLSPIQTALTADLVAVALDIIVVLGAGAMMIIYGGWLAAVALVALILNLMLRLAAYGPYRAANEAAIVHGAKEDTHFMETVRGIASIKALNLHKRRQGTWLNLLIDAVNAGLRIKKLDLLFGTAGTFLAAADGIVMLWLGARAVIDGSMTMGMLIAFITYKGMFIGRAQALIGFAINLRMLSLHSERLADIALTEPEEAAGAEKLTTTFPGAQRQSGRLQAVGVRFRYGDGEPEVLDGVDLTIEPGDCRSVRMRKDHTTQNPGRIDAANRGMIQLNGQDIRNVGLDNYRSIVSCVLQEDRLFAGSIAENISSFDPYADQAWIEECARLTAIEGDIRKMVMGWETLVGDMGSALSGGQKQRLFLARALYRKPAILFLDEATSHLDTENEAAINNAVGNLRISRVIVAHRQSTIAMADRQIALDAGRICSLQRPHP
jgi:ATP-binding cassette subfamily B protein RaxB